MIVSGIHRLIWVGQSLAVVGDFPAAFALVYAVGAIAAFGIGFYALKKSREVNADNVEQRSQNVDD